MHVVRPESGCAVTPIEDNRGSRTPAVQRRCWYDIFRHRCTGGHRPRRRRSDHSTGAQPGGSHTAALSGARPSCTNRCTAARSRRRIGQWIRNAPSTRPRRTTQRNCSASTSFETDGFARDPLDRASSSRRSAPTSSHAEQEPRSALQRILDAASQSQHLRPQIELAAQEIGAALEATRSAWTASSRRLSDQETKLDALGRTPIPPLPGPQSMHQTLTSGVPSQPWRNGGARCVQPARAASGR